MARGIDLTDNQLAQIGVTRGKDAFGTVYSVPCDSCGEPVHTRTYSTNKKYVCRFCKSEVAKRTIEKREKRHEAIVSVFQADSGLDPVHFKRFESAACKFGDAYDRDVELARTVADRFDSVPEAVACIELLHIGAKVIAHQKVGDYTVDFCLPDDKLVVEIDGSIYHADETREQMRDYALKHMLGDGWEVRHIPADAVMRNHRAFGSGMRKMLEARRNTA